MTTANLAQLSPDEVVAKAERVLQMAYLARDAQRDSQAYLAQASGTVSVQDVTPTLAEGAAPTCASEPERCPYCKRLQSDCEQLRKEHPEVWEVVCSRHPDVQKQKDDRATAEMMESLRRYGPYRY